MVSQIVKVLIYTTIPVAIAILGSGFAAFRPPGSKLKSFVQHFAAGVVFAAAAVELLPDEIHAQSPVGLIIGSTLGVAVMLTIKWLSEKTKESISLITTVGVDVLIDGFVLGIGFAVGEKQGLLLTFALSIELLFLGLSVSATLNQINMSRKRIVTTTAGLALLLPLGAVMGTLLKGLSSSILAIFFAFGLVALLYLVTEELLVEAHEVEDNPLITAVFFVGFFLLILVDELVAPT